MVRFSRYAGLAIVFAWFFFGGVSHFTNVDFFTAIMPPYVPYPLAAVYVSGALEVLFAIGILIPVTREWSGNLLILLTLAVTPANVHMWLHPELVSRRVADPVVGPSRGAGAAAVADLVEHANAAHRRLGRPERRCLTGTSTWCAAPTAAFTRA